MKLWFSISVLTLVGLAFQNCAPADSQTSNIVFESKTPQSYEANTRQTPEKVEFKGEKVDFKGVSFKYNPKILGKVTAEDIPDYPLEEPDFKPDGVAPQHVKFTFDCCKNPYCWEGSLEVYPIDEFPQMYSVNKDLVSATEKEIQALRDVLKDKNFRYEDQIPYIPFIDAGQSFQTKVKLSKFDKGDGIFFVTYLSTEVALISNDHLRYIFEGLTNDGKYYVLAEIPVSVKFLPEDPATEEFEGYQRKFLFEDYPNPDTIKKRYEDYISSITTRLEKLPAHGFHPDLKYLEEIIASLKIEK